MICGSFRACSAKHALALVQNKRGAAATLFFLCSQTDLRGLAILNAGLVFRSEWVHCDAVRFETL